MNVEGLLKGKGTEVHSIAPSSSVSDLLAVLAQHRVGALVVSADGQAVDGIVSERDVVRALAERGPDLLAEPVADVMTTDVVTCSPGTTVEQLMVMMTSRRIRHVPVVIDDRLAGIVSIGDVVKDRMDELETETKVLHEYIAHGR
jgi:CBS domain-containing protein